MIIRARTLAAGLAAIAVTALLAGCSREAPKGPVKGPAAVTVLTVERKEVPITAVYVAQTQSSQAVEIRARVSGFLNKRVYTEGAVVKAGQVLFQMDPKPFQAQVDAQKAALQRNVAANEVAKANLARTKPLAQQNALSQKDLDDAQGQFDQTAAAVEQGKAQLTEAQLNLSYTTIVSPVAGASSYANVADGTYLNAQNSLLTTVSVLTPMWINFSVSENEVERIRGRVKSGFLRLPPGGEFVVEIEMVDGTLFPYTGRITFADPSYNPSTGTFLLRATVNNPAGVLRPNQYVRVRLQGAVHPNAIVVPLRAVQQGAKGHFVWVVNQNNRAELRPVVVSEWKGEGWLIAEGLETGDRVVVDGGIRVTEGAAVQATAYRPPPVVAPAVSPTAAPISAPTAAFGGPARIAGPAAHTPVYFASGQATLDAAARSAVRSAATGSMAIGTQLTVTGYADATGNAAANVELAKRRALAVRDALVADGIQPARIRLSAPANVTGSGSDDQARRVDITVGN